MAKKSEKIVFQGTGRRKKSIARVALSEGKGEIIVNGKKEETLQSCKGIGNRCSHLAEVCF